jgi:hypothetical protein
VNAGNTEHGEHGEHSECLVFTSIQVVKWNVVEYCCFQPLESQIICYILSLHAQTIDMEKWLNWLNWIEPKGWFDSVRCLWIKSNCIVSFTWGHQIELNHTRLCESPDSVRLRANSVQFDGNTSHRPQNNLHTSVVIWTWRFNQANGM